MDFIELAKNRYSVRKYQEREIEREKLEYVLQAGRIAPSAVNFQPWRFIVAREAGMKETVCSTYNRDWIKAAPAIIVLCGVHGEAWRRADGKDHCDIDVAIAADHMTLAAVEKGLGTCWVCNFDSMALAKALRLPKGTEPAVLLPIGYPADSADPERHGDKRKAEEEIIFWDSVPV